MEIKLFNKILIIIVMFTLIFTLSSCKNKKIEYELSDTMAFSKIERFYKIKKEFISLKKYKANQDNLSTEEEILYYHYEEIIYDAYIESNRNRESLVFLKKSDDGSYEIELIFFSREEDYPELFENFKDSKDNLLNSFDEKYLNKFYRRGSIWLEKSVLFFVYLLLQWF